MDDCDVDDGDATVDYDFSSQLQPLHHVGYRASHAAFAVRDSFRDYFASDVGQLPWQRASSVC